MVVVGSGYGGSIAASRCARAGQSVCVLERGKEWLPGDFPETFLNAWKEVQIHAGGKKDKIGKTILTMRQIKITINLKRLKNTAVIIKARESAGLKKRLWSKTHLQFLPNFATMAICDHSFIFIFFLQGNHVNDCSILKILIFSKSA